MHCELEESQMRGETDEADDGETDEADEEIELNAD